MTPEEQAAQEAVNQQKIALRDDTGGDWAKANERYFASVKQAREVQAQNAALAAENEAFKQRYEQLGSMLGNRGNQSQDPFQQLESEYAVPAGMMRQAVLSTAQEAVNQALSPIVNGIAAREAAVTKYGQDFVDKEAEMLQYIKSDPTTQATYSKLMSLGEHQVAYDYGWKSFLGTQSANQTSQVDTARRNAAALPNSTGGGVNRNQQGSESQTTLEQAMEYSRRTRDIRPTMTELFRGKPLTYTEQLEAALKNQG